MRRLSRTALCKRQLPCSLALLLLGSRKPTLPEILEIGKTEHALQGEDSFFLKLLKQCDLQTPEGRDAESLIQKLIERRVYRPLMIIPGDRAANHIAAMGKAEPNSSDNEHRLRTFATILESAYYSPFLLFVSACVEKYLQGYFDSDTDVAKYGAAIVADESSDGAARAMALVPSKVIIWTTPFKQLYKDPAVMVATKDVVVRIDELGKTSKPLNDQSIVALADSSIKAADQKYATMWKLYVFLSNSLFYTGVLQKFSTANSERARQFHSERLEKAIAFFRAAFDALVENWADRCGHWTTSADRQRILSHAMDSAHFRTLVGRWIGVYLDQQPKNHDESANRNPAVVLSTVNIDHYVHGWDDSRRRPTSNCRDIRFKVDEDATEEWQHAIDNPTFLEGQFVGWLQAIGITRADAMAKSEFKDLCRRYEDHQTICDELLESIKSGEHAPRPIDLRALWDGDLPKVKTPAGAYSVESDVHKAGPERPAFKDVILKRGQVRDDLLRESHSLSGHVRIRFANEIRALMKFIFVDITDPKIRPLAVDDLNKRIRNERSKIFSNFKMNQVLTSLRRKWLNDNLFESAAEDAE